jgi:hypothetical protein
MSAERMSADRVHRIGNNDVVRSRALAIHAWTVGAGWFVLAFLTLVVVLPSRPGWVADLPHPIQGAGVVLIAVIALPLAWPVYIALGWYEAGLVERLAHGDLRAATRARRLLLSQAAVFAGGAAAAGALAVAIRSRNGAEYVSIAWLPLIAIAVAHLLTARAMLRS